jgi:hypothetical protein
MLTAKCATSCRSEEEDIEPSEQDGIDAEEVGGQHLIGVLADELAPGVLAAARSGLYPMTPEHSADGQVGALVAELEQLALDATVSPA